MHSLKVQYCDEIWVYILCCSLRELSLGYVAVCVSMSLWASVCVVEGKQLGNKEERVLAAEYSQQSRQRPSGAHTPTHYPEKTHLNSLIIMQIIFI